MEYAYATCLLNESGEEINEKNLKAVLEAAGSEVQESRVKALVAALEDIEIDSAVDFEDLGSDPAHDGEATTEGPSAPAESDLTDASGMELVSAESEDGLDRDDDLAESADVPADGVTETASNGAEIETDTDADEV